MPAADILTGVSFLGAGVLGALGVDARISWALVGLGGLLIIVL